MGWKTRRAEWALNLSGSRTGFQLRELSASPSGDMRRIPDYGRRPSCPTLC